MIRSYKRSVIRWSLFIIVVMGVAIWAIIPPQPPNMAVYVAPVAHAQNPAIVQTSVAVTASADNAVDAIIPEAPNCTAVINRNGDLGMWTCDNGKHSEGFDKASFDSVVNSPDSVTLASFWVLFNYAGNRLDLVYASGGCDGATYQIGDLNAIGWGNAISSAKVFSPCWTAELFANTYFGGAHISCAPSCANLSTGGFNDNAESIQVR